METFSAETEQSVESLKRRMAQSMFELGVVKFDMDDPVRYKSGMRSPIYTDNRLFTGSPDHWTIALENLKLQLEPIEDIDYIAAVPTAGIPHAAALARELGIPMVSVRAERKEHGLSKQIEGADPEDLKGKNIVVVEDLVTTGGSTKGVVEVLRESEGTVSKCISLFNYGLPDAVETFDELDCQVLSALSLSELLSYAKSEGLLSDSQIAEIEDWQSNPEDWGKKYD